MTAARRTRLRSPLALAASLCVVLSGTPAEAYLKLGVRVGSRMVTLSWSTTPIQYWVNERGVPGVTPEGFRQAAERAFQTWQDVPSARVTFQFAGFTSAEPLEDDDRNTLGFLPRPDLDRVLASTSFLVDTRTGAILESDIFFNSEFAWSTAAEGEPGAFDLESIALHEAGHVLGLGHSAIGETELRPGGGRRVIVAESVMFPVAFSPGNIEGRRLTADDIAGVSDIYPSSDFRQRTGSVQGRVTRSGRGVFGAHVVAYSLRTGALVASFTLQDETGDFVIAGLRPGLHVIRAEPLDDGDIESFFDEDATVDMDFRPSFYDRLVVVPRGGSTRRIEVMVVPK